MSKRTLRPKPTTGKKYTEINSSDTIIIDESQDDSECSTVILKRSRDSDFVYVSSEDEESPKRKNVKAKKPARKSLKRKKVQVETKVEPSTSSRQSVSEDEETPKKKIKLSTKAKKPALKSKTQALKNKTPALKRKTLPNFNIKFEWDDEDLLAEKENLQTTVAQSMVKLFAQGDTIPFIARYRRHLTGNMTPEKIRHLKESFDEIIELKSKICTVLNNISKSGKLKPDLERTISSCRSLEELDHIYEPYKPANKKSLAERAKSLGLEEAAIAILNGDLVNIDSLIKQNGPEGLRNRKEVENNIMHIIGNIIAHHSDVLTFLRELRENMNLQVLTKISATAKKNSKDENVIKFDRYHDNKFSVKFIQPHQVLAINRGESLKILTVKIDVPDWVFNKFKYFCEQKWLNNSKKYPDRVRLIQDTIAEIYTKNTTRLISRKTRTELKSAAHKAAIEVFAKNVKQLLLEPPVKGKAIMGIDPGFKFGCKIALISQFGDVLDTDVIYLNIDKKCARDAEIVKNLLFKHNCTLVAIGNGTACRETESWLTDLIQSKYFKPLDISYTIVDESGASVYSCSEEAKKEFGDLDPLKISAISLARRVQDPLAELVKIDPKSLGVGMYQHDLNQKLLDKTLDEVISECVSFVGVDLNTASHCLLRRVAGLTPQKAENIIKHRQEKGPFTNRYQLKDVKGIGDKIFEQCAGFLRLMPSNSIEAVKFYERPETTPLDATDIHPEAYEIAEKILEKFGLFYKQIGLPDFINTFKSHVQKISVGLLAKEYSSTEQTINLIIDALSKPLAYDLRSENPHGAIFKKNITTLADITPGLSLTGRVTNVVAFGAFVDLGVGKNGLIHNSKLNGGDISIGQRVKVKVLSIENNGARIGLELENVLN